MAVPGWLQYASIVMGNLAYISLPAWMQHFTYCLFPEPQLSEQIITSLNSLKYTLERDKRKEMVDEAEIMELK